MKQIYCLLWLLWGVCVSQVKANDQEQYKEIFELGLPVVIINTVDGALPTAEYVDTPEGCWGLTINNKTKVNGRLRKYSKDGTLLYDSGDYTKDKSGISLKLRGNTSAHWPKKPYKVTIEKAADLLCRDNDKYNDKEFALLTPRGYYDYPSPIVQMIGTWVQKHVCKGWYPENEFVNVIINDDYQGLYCICETVKRNSDCRIDIDGGLGFIAEIDPYWWNENMSIETSIFKYESNPFKLTLKYPDEKDYSENYFSYIKDYFETFENSLATDNIDKYLDFESWARWLLAHDILGSDDFAGSNIFTYKYDITHDTKLCMGPLWDFDTIEQTENRWSSIHTFQGLYFYQLLQNEQFVELYNNIYNEESEDIFNKIIQLHQDFKNSDLKTALNASISKDIERWPYRYMEDVDEAIENSQMWFVNRKAWMDGAIAKTDVTYSKQTGISENSIGQQSENTENIYSITGVRINKPNKGLNIIKYGKNRSAKVFIK